MLIALELVVQQSITLGAHEGPCCLPCGDLDTKKETGSDRVSVSSPDVPPVMSLPPTGPTFYRFPTSHGSQELGTTPGARGLWGALQMRLPQRASQLKQVTGPQLVLESSEVGPAKVSRFCCQQGKLTVLLPGKGAGPCLPLADAFLGADTTQSLRQKGNVIVTHTYALGCTFYGTETI